MMHEGKFLNLPVLDKGAFCFLNFFIGSVWHYIVGIEYNLFFRWKYCCLSGCFTVNSSRNCFGKHHAWDIFLCLARGAIFEIYGKFQILMTLFLTHMINLCLYLICSLSITELSHIYHSVLKIRGYNFYQYKAGTWLWWGFQVENCSSGGANDMTNTVMQKFWDSAFSTEPMEDFDSHRYSGVCGRWCSNVRSFFVIKLNHPLRFFIAVIYLG